jgi:hypothetical protein
LPIRTLVACVIQLDAQHRPHGGRVAQEEVDVLAIDAVAIALVLVGSNHEEDIREIHLRAH